MAMFEAPVAHEAIHYSNPYSNPEFEFEEELSHYSNPEVSHYSNPYSNPEFEVEEGRSHGRHPQGSHYSNPYINTEFEDVGKLTNYSSHVARRQGTRDGSAVDGVDRG